MDLAAVIVEGIAIVFFACLMVSLAACFLLWGARIAGIENRSFPKAVLVVILSCIAGAACGAVFTFVLQVDFREWVNYVVSFVVEAFVVMLVFKTSFGKALVASVVSFVLSMVVIGGIVILILIVVLGGAAFLR